MAWMLAAQSCVILPLFFYLPLWLPAIWIVTTIWRVQIFRGVLPFPGKFLRTALGLICIAALLATFRGRMGVEPMVSFLLCGFTLKLIEANKPRDVLIVLYICFVAIAAQFLFSQTLLATFIGLMCLIVVLGAMVSLYSGELTSVGSQLRKSGTLVLQSVPIMLVLFIVMPRLGQLWAVPSSNNTSTTGFSETMSPGSMSELIRSNALAFRVTFEGAEVPPPQERYWRGLVLEYFDGRNWRPRRWRSGVMSGRVDKDTSRPSSWDLQINPEGKTYEYSIILEPHNHPWLFTLMAPVWLNSPENVGAGYHEDYLLVGSKPVHSRVQYQVRSSPAYQVTANNLASDRLKRNLTLPENINPRSQKLVEDWLRESHSPQEVMQTALSYFNQNLSYTLNPPLLGADSVDELLFLSKRGFCEHFASSFVYLMRLANIPARVVVGYQGGELNNIENYLMVRQSDAHAWAEVWLQGQGWVRVDPTSAVAPNRIDRGLRDSVTEEDAALITGMFDAAFIYNLRNYWDVLGYHWHRWVLDYDDENQKSLFEKLLGGTEVWRVALLFAGGCGAVLALYALMLLVTRENAPLRAEDKIYKRFLVKLSRRGIQRNKHEAPMDFAKRAGKLQPELQRSVENITRLYCAIAYQGQMERLASFKRCVREF